MIDLKFNIQAMSGGVFVQKFTVAHSITRKPVKSVWYTVHVTCHMTRDIASGIGDNSFANGTAIRAIDLLNSMEIEVKETETHFKKNLGGILPPKTEVTEVSKGKVFIHSDADFLDGTTKLRAILSGIGDYSDAIAKIIRQVNFYWKFPFHEPKPAEKRPKHSYQDDDEGQKAFEIQEGYEEFMFGD